MGDEWPKTNDSYMPRPQRIEYSGAWYYVTNTGNQGKTIFRDEADYKGFLNLLGEASRIFSIEIHSYALTEKAYHLVVHTPKGELSRAMRHINGVYTQNMNKRWGKQGALFSGRYKAIVIDPDESLASLVAYIHNVPVKECLCHKPAAYAWASHIAYLREKERPDWLVTEKVMRPFGFIKPIALTRFHKMVTKGVMRSMAFRIENTQEILGSTEFKQSLKKVKKKKTQKSVEAPQNRQKRTRSAKEILDFVAAHYEMPVNQVKQSQSGIQNEARSMAVYQMRTVAGMSQKEIAKHLNSKNPYTMAKVLERFHTKIENDNTLKVKTTEITSKITEKLNS